MNTELEKPSSLKMNIPLEQFYCYGRNLINNSSEINIKRDQLIKNRYWIKFPAFWRTAEQKERVIGIRSLWNSEENRLLEFHVVLRFDDEKGEEHLLESNFRFHLPIAGRNSLMYPLNDAMKEHLRREIARQNMSEYFDENDIFFHFIVYREPNNKNKNKYILTCECPKNKLYKFTNMNDDTVNVFNSFDEEGQPIRDLSFHTYNEFPDVWDREYIMMTSSIATNTINNQIGFTGVRYQPIKYYKLESNQINFYVDLWISHYINIPCVLPKDGKDGFTIECILLDNDKQLYT